jgi:hypothetical protein
LSGAETTTQGIFIYGNHLIPHPSIPNAENAERP